MSYKADAWLIDECQIAFFISCLILRNLVPPFFCRHFLCHLSYRQQFVWYPGYHGYQFYAALLEGRFSSNFGFGCGGVVLSHIHIRVWSGCDK